MDDVEEPREPLIAGTCLFGICSGISLNVTFALVIDRAQLSGYGTASTLWKLAYDAGDEADPAAFGVFMAAPAIDLRPRRDADARRAGTRHV